MCGCVLMCGVCVQCVGVLMCGVFVQCVCVCVICGVVCNVWVFVNVWECLQCVSVC
jgi:hypothetical protein